jgi:hypothetical protein
MFIYHSLFASNNTTHSIGSTRKLKVFPKIPHKVQQQNSVEPTHLHLISNDTTVAEVRRVPYIVVSKLPN